MQLQTLNPVAELAKFYQSLEFPTEEELAEGITEHQYENGPFGVTKLKWLEIGIDYLLRDKIIDERELFFDAGFGTGAVLAMTGGIYGMQSYGLDFRKAMVTKSGQNLEKLRESGIISPNTPIRIAYGNFLKNKHYHKELGVIFFHLKWNLHKK